MNIILYAAPFSSATPVVNTLAELDVPYELRLVDFATPEAWKPEVGELNPNQKVPTLVVGGTPMFEACAIMQWLGDRFGVERGLWPAADDPRRLTALSWTTWTYVELGGAIRRLGYATSDRAPAELHNAAHEKHARGALQEQLGMLDARLQTRDHILGDAFSLADVIVSNAVAYGVVIGMLTSGHDHVERWLARCQERPAYQNAWAAVA